MKDEGSVIKGHFAGINEESMEYLFPPILQDYVSRFDIGMNQCPGMKKIQGIKNVKHNLSDLIRLR
ncbi:MAG: hypothetical protein GXO83_03340 [Chlorobi bacterium]|nr:hypothetical protein [Chlorobiota bacterium]